MRMSFLALLPSVISLTGLVTHNAPVSHLMNNQEERQIVKRIRAAPDVPIRADVLVDTPLQIVDAIVKQISETDFRHLTGEASKYLTPCVSFPNVTLINTSSKTIKAFAIAVRNVVDTRSGYDVLYQRHVAILPGAKYQVISEQWLKAEKTTVNEGGQFVTRTQKPGVESPRFWISAAASDLRVAIAVVDFEDGSRWTRPKD